MKGGGNSCMKPKQSGRVAPLPRMASNEIFDALYNEKQYPYPLTSQASFYAYTALKNKADQQRMKNQDYVEYGIIPTPLPAKYQNALAQISKIMDTTFTVKPELFIRTRRLKLGPDKPPLRKHKNSQTGQETTYCKPYGTWYGIHCDWLDYNPFKEQSNFSHDQTLPEHVRMLELKFDNDVFLTFSDFHEKLNTPHALMNKILSLNCYNIEEMWKFTNLFGEHTSTAALHLLQPFDESIDRDRIEAYKKGFGRFVRIEWQQLEKLGLAGIELVNYPPRNEHRYWRTLPYLQWMDGWDVSSGCCWRSETMQDANLLEFVDQTDKQPCAKKGLFRNIHANYRGEKYKFRAFVTMLLEKLNDVTTIGSARSLSMSVPRAVSKSRPSRAESTIIAQSFASRSPTRSPRAVTSRPVRSTQSARRTGSRALAQIAPE